MDIKSKSIDIHDRKERERERDREIKKRIASLQLCVLTLHRNHANLLCIVKRLFNARVATRAIEKAILRYIKTIIF